MLGAVIPVMAVFVKVAAALIVAELTALIPPVPMVTVCPFTEAAARVTS